MEKITLEDGRLSLAEEHGVIMHKIGKLTQGARNGFSEAEHKEFQDLSDKKTRIEIVLGHTERDIESIRDKREAEYDR